MKSTDFYIYIYRDPSRGNEPIYVGKGCRSRATRHLKRSDDNHFPRRLAKMKRGGVSPSIEIIRALDESHAFFMEECVIQVLGRRDLGTGTLLNCTAGGEGNAGRVFTETHRSRLSKALKGKPLSEEHKKTISETVKAQQKVSGNAFLGKTHSEEARNKMSTWRKKPCTVDGIQIFNSVHELREVLGRGANGYKHPAFRFV